METQTLRPDLIDFCFKIYNITVHVSNSSSCFQLVESISRSFKVKSIQRLMADMVVCSLLSQLKHFLLKIEKGKVLLPGKKSLAQRRLLLQRR